MVTEVCATIFASVSVVSMAAVFIAMAKYASESNKSPEESAKIGNASEATLKHESPTRENNQTTRRNMTGKIEDKLKKGRATSRKTRRRHS